MDKALFQHFRDTTYPGCDEWLNPVVMERLWLHAWPGKRFFCSWARAVFYARLCGSLSGQHSTHASVSPVFDQSDPDPPTMDTLGTTGFARPLLEASWCSGNSQPVCS